MGWAFGFLILGLWGAGARAQAPAPQTPPPAADTRTFAPTAHFEKGQKVRYQTQGNMRLTFVTANGANTLQSQNADMESVMRYVTREIKPDGSAVLSALSDGGKMIFETPVLLPKEPDSYPRTATLDKQAKILAVKDPTTSAQKAGALDGLFNQTNLFIALHFLPLPEKPVKIGETWSVRYPLPNAKLDAKTPPTGNEPTKTDETADDPTAIRAVMTLLDTAKVAAQETLRIKEVITVPFEVLVDAKGKATTDSKKATGSVSVRLIFTQIANILPDSGQVVQTNGELGGWIRLTGDFARQLPSSTMVISGTIAAVRLLDGATPLPANAKKGK